jgi:hypothetical protein
LYSRGDRPQAPGELLDGKRAAERLIPRTWDVGGLRTELDDRDRRVAAMRSRAVSSTPVGDPLEAPRRTGCGSRRPSRIELEKSKTRTTSALSRHDGERGRRRTDGGHERAADEHERSQGRGGDLGETVDLVSSQDGFERVPRLRAIVTPGG